MLFQPLPLAAVSRCALMVGMVLSMFTSLTVALAELPATSVTVKVWDWPAPSAVEVKVPVSVPATRPDWASLAL